jgi:hypothetical protein
MIAAGTSTTGTNRQFNPALARYQGTFSAPQVLYFDPDNAVLLRRKTQTDTRSVFKMHEAKWKRDTEYISSLSEKYLHSSYARIIGLGWPAVPLILDSLAREPNDWFYALHRCGPS